MKLKNINQRFGLKQDPVFCRKLYHGEDSKRKTIWNEKKSIKESVTRWYLPFLQKKFRK